MFHFVDEIQFELKLNKTKETIKSIYICYFLSRKETMKKLLYFPQTNLNY
jgi:hypothetical protein